MAEARKNRGLSRPMAEARKNEREGPVFRDIRRYYCDYCGICRSKKALIAAHVLSQHHDQIWDVNVEANQPVLHKCEACGACFRKPAYLKQHMQGHSLE